ncbi:MAG: histidine kinase [Nocardiopsaceae bacterium]|nr:histidine kinase [Nocardiopsaceae bacterium]
MQLRFLLTGIALLLLPADRVSLPIIVLTLLFATLTAFVAWYWERVTPYLLEHPLLVTMDIFCATAILMVDGPTGPFFVATVLTATVAGLLFHRWGAVAAVSFQMFCYYSALLSFSAIDSGQPSESLLNFQVIAVNPLLYPVAGFVGIQLRRIFAQLSLEQRKREEAEIAAAAAEERARLARDMHDSVVKTLRGAAMAAQSLPIWVQKDPERAVATASQVAEAAERAAQEARDLITDLREEVADVPFTKAVSAVLDEWGEETGVPVRLHAAAGDFSLLIAARQEGIAILSEALTNIDRHANADSVTVTLEHRPAGAAETGVASSAHTAKDPPRAGYLLMRVRDDGQGFEAPVPGPDPVSDEIVEKTGHYGLRGMAERAQRVGGTLTVLSTPGSGTEVLLQLPCSPYAQEAQEAVP